MLNLMTWLGLETVTKNKTESALKYLETEGAKIKLIIVRSVIDKEDTAKAILEFLKSKNLAIPVVVAGPGKEYPGSVAHVPNSLQIKPLIQAAAKALGITAKEMTQKVVPEYFPIPITHFKILKRSICSVYIQNADKTYSLRLEKNKDFTPETIDKMIQDGVTYLYVGKMDRLEFVNNVTSELMVNLAPEDLSEDEQISATDKGIELLSKKLLTIGVTEETVAEAKKHIEVLKKNSKQNPKLAKLLQRLLSNRASYLFKHTQVLTYVSLHIVRNIDWGNPEQEEKISFISFFHDIVLTNDEQAQIKTNNELKRSQLPTDQKSLVEKHAQLAAELAIKFPHAPMGADQIIRQHHGTLNGIGFSDHFGNNVSPMSIVFIVAEEFTRIIMKNEGETFDRKSMLGELKDTFPTSRFQKVIQLLETITF